MADQNFQEQFKSLVSELPFGKRLPAAHYILDTAQGRWPPRLRDICQELRRRLEIGSEFNLLKFHLNQPKISFLSYPEFDSSPHPTIRAAIVVDLIGGHVRRDNYLNRANPPILHRKETFLPGDHEDFEKYRRLTRQEEAAGLLESPSTIGFQQNWDELLRSKGVRLRGHRLVKLDGETLTLTHHAPIKSAAQPIQRHKTAIVRTELSRPIKLLIEHGLLGAPHSVFDFGCGFGSDVDGLKALGYSAVGWDPVHSPSNAQIEAEIVNVGYVINVIENPAERVEVLQKAWGLTRKLLVVSVLIASQEAYGEFKCHGDGILTSRNTFQKYFAPAEIQALIEDVLQTEAIPLSLGVYLVFRDLSDAQDFLSSRSQRYVDWTTLSHRLGLRQVLKRKQDPYDSHRELMDSFWQVAITLGRVPREDEFGQWDEVRKVCGSLPKAMAFFIERFGRETFEAARAKRREDTLVYVAATRLRKRVPFSRLSTNLQRDIRSFFGSQAEAEHRALEVMYAAGDVDELAMAIEKLGFGWWDPGEEQFTIHRDLLDELPAILRVYVECAARLFGNPKEADLIKFHLRSRKLTFLHYHDFDEAPFPELRMRIKIDLPRLFVTVFDQRMVPERQLLYFKERFVAPDFVGRRRMELISARLQKLGFCSETMGHGPDADTFEQLLRDNGLTRDLRSK